MPFFLQKAVCLLDTLRTAPTEFADRVRAALEVRSVQSRRRPSTYVPQPWQAVRAKLAAMLDSEIQSMEHEAALLFVEEQVRRTLKRLAEDGPFNPVHNADFLTARLCYLATRVLRPEVVVETGVAYGVTTAFILQALRQNGRGRLYSIDLPPLGPKADRFVGKAVPTDLHDRWHLFRGASARVLPDLLQRIRKVDLFVHDSLHTYRNMWSEFTLIAPYLSRPSILICDDAEANRAFDDWTTLSAPSLSTLIAREGKAGLVGICVYLQRSDSEQSHGQFDYRPRMVDGHWQGEAPDTTPPG